MYNYNNPNKKKNTKAWAPKPEKTVQTNRTNRKASFMDKVEKTAKGYYTQVAVPTLPADKQYTSNGAIAYKSSGSALLDINTSISALRSLPDGDIVKKFRAAYSENPRLAIRWLFYAGDIREGQGERRLFKICLEDMMNNGGAQIVANLIPMIPEYSRWDYIYAVMDNPTTMPVVRELIRKQWKEDMANMKKGKSISLMAKWLDSASSHSHDTRKRGLKTMDMLGLTEREYRKGLSALRKHLDVVERKMSSQNWQSIDYETVPSKANLNYNNAFLRNDEERRRAYLNALTKGEAKINSSVANPCDIVHKYCDGSWNSAPRSYDATLEGMWKSLPNLVTDDSSTIVVADGSGSMCTNVGRTRLTALEVANSLAIYFAERAKGAYKGRYITFSSRPQMVNVNHDSLRENLMEAARHNEIDNTNLEAVFDLILETAIDNHSPQSDLPKNILIISDGGWDSMVNIRNISTGGRGYGGYGYWGYNSTRATAQEAPAFLKSIEQKYKDAGYEMSKIIFWNVAGACNTGNGLPMTKNDYGIMVSGFSVNTLKAVLSGKTNPWDALMEVLLNKRYDTVETKAFA